MMMLPTGRDSSSNPVKRSRWLNIYLQMGTAANFHRDYGYANEFLVKKNPKPVSHVTPGGLRYSTSGLRPELEINDKKSASRSVFSPLRTRIFNVGIRDENGVVHKEGRVGNRFPLCVSWRRTRPGNAQLDDGVVWDRRLGDALNANRECGTGNEEQGSH